MKTVLRSDSAVLFLPYRHSWQHLVIFYLGTPGCAVLVAETILDGETPYAALQSLNMLVQTEGQERTKEQYADLLRQHGFGVIRAVQTSNFLDAFMACKV